jgi:AraC family transcriptional regulator, chitin signaling transcriptional activator
LKKAFSYILILLLFPVIVMSRQLPEKGVPQLRNYSPLQYNMQGKVWDIDSAPNGIVYMASERGLLEFDGKTWRSFEGSDSFTRSVLVVNDSLIYTGSDLDFGVWNRNGLREFEYTSLYPFRDTLAELNEEFWEIYRDGDSVIFVSDNNIYIYSSGNLTKISAPHRFTGSFKSGDTIYFADERAGLFAFSDLSLQPLAAIDEDVNFELTGIYDYEGGLVLVTRNSGLLFYEDGILSPLTTELSRDLLAANVFSFDKIDEDYLVFGTVQNGLIITGPEGRRIIHRINRNKGLPNNTVLALHYSPAGRLWMAMDYGISSIDLLSNLSYFYDFEGTFGTGYSAYLQNGVFFLGTNKGLYKADWDGLNNDTESFDFEFIPGSDGQTWTLKKIGNDLLIGHDRGLFQMIDNSLTRISDRSGFWTLEPYNEYLLGGTYNGVIIFQRNQGRWIELKQMELILGSTNQLLIEGDNTLWINIPNYGIIRSVLDEDLYPNERKPFFTESFEGRDPVLIKEGDKIQVATDSFVYSYSETDSSFSILAEKGEKGGPQDAMRGIYGPVELNSEYVFYPIYNGFALSTPEWENQAGAASPEVVFRKMEMYNNEEIKPLLPGQKVSYSQNNLSASFLVPNHDGTEYQYRLGINSDWSEWSNASEQDFVNLTPGDYQFFVRARVNELITESANFSFSILPPWYRSWPAYAFYLLLTGMIVFSFYAWQSITLKRQEEQLMMKQQKSLKKQAEKHSKEMFKLEQEKLKEEYGQLKKELKSKTIELANKAKDNQDKNRLLLTLKEKIEKTRQNPDHSRSSWDEIHKLLDAYIHNEDNTFEIQMDELHQEFFRKLKKRFPDLSANELRLCAYIKLGFNSKEIADFSNIQPSSVYINRSRLRKKLELDSDEDLQSFLNNV